MYLVAFLMILGVVGILFFLLHAWSEWFREEVVYRLAGKSPTLEDLVGKFFAPAALTMTLLCFASAFLVWPQSGPSETVDQEGSEGGTTPPTEGGPEPPDADRATRSDGSTASDESVEDRDAATHSKPNEASRQTSAREAKNRKDGEQESDPDRASRHRPGLSPEPSALGGGPADAAISTPEPPPQQPIRTSVATSPSAEIGDSHEGSRPIQPPSSDSIPQIPDDVVYEVKGRVIWKKEKVDQGVVSWIEEPIVGASVKAGGSSAPPTNQTGDFTLSLPFVPDTSDRTLVVVRHERFMPEFLRLADIKPGTRTQISMEPKWRVTVADFVGTLEGEEYREARRIIGQGIRDRLGQVPELTMTAEEHREEIIKKLYDYQQRRALYDKETLARVGELSGAALGVFGFVQKISGHQIRLSCDLTDLSTAEKKASAYIFVESPDQLGLAGEQLADELLFQLTQVQVLYPRDKARCGELIAAKGFTRFRPKDRAVTVTVQPPDLEKHFPQPPTDEPEDGTWSAPRIHLGDGSPITSEMTFQLWPILVNRQKIEEFALNCSRSTPQDFSKWTRDLDYKLFSAITVTQAPSAARDRVGSDPQPLGPERRR